MGDVRVGVPLHIVVCLEPSRYETGTVPHTLGLVVVEHQI